MGAPRYVISDPIEVGAQGSVVSALDTRTQKTVALKIFDLTTEKGKIGFSTEVGALQALQGKSTKICEILDILSVEGNYGIIAMKKYEKDLFDFVVKQTCEPSSASIKKLFRAICKAVRTMHTNGVAHLDLKLENVLLDRKGNPFLCDFGCSYVHTCPTKSRFTFRNKVSADLIAGIDSRGTQKYAAPEVFVKGNAYDPFAADIFSLGVMLHVLTTGYYPGRKDLSFASKVVDDVCFSIIDGMLQKDPKARMNINEVLAHSWFKTNLLNDLKRKLLAD